MARNPAFYNLLTRVDDDKEVTEIIVRGSYCDGKALHQLRLPGDVLVLALRRNGEVIIPHGNTQLECGDHLTLAGSIEGIQEAHSMFTM